MKLQTRVEWKPAGWRISQQDNIVVLGSCFADNIALQLTRHGFNTCPNPFGTLYNPLSLAQAVERLDSGTPFTAADCLPMGAGAGLICSLNHHTSFARPTEEEFLDNANTHLSRAVQAWKDCNVLIITLGTSWYFKREGKVVANCLKRDAREFERNFLPATDTVEALERIATSAGSGRRVLLTVSPIRHMADGAHGNAVSKSALLLATDEVCASHRDNWQYFPSYEILMDELRDYRFYAEDLVHPSGTAVEYIWERFVETMVPENEREALASAERAFRASQHRPTR